MRSDIEIKQNDPEALALLRGVRQAYEKAKRLGTIQLSLSSLAVIASPLAACFAPQFKPYIAFYGTAVLVLNLVFLEPVAKKNHETGAKIQEMFDAHVLSFPWKIRDPPDAELRHELANEYVEDESAPLKNWYPAGVDALPIELARLVCQRANLKWDAGIREHVSQVYWLAVFVLIAGAVFYAMAKDLNMGAFVLEVLMPLTPIGVRLAQKAVEHKTAAESSDRGKNAVVRVWNHGISGELTAKELDDEARILQADIFDGRRRAPQVPDFLYEHKRRKFEGEMAAAAKAMIDEAKRALVRDASRVGIA